MSNTIQTNPSPITTTLNGDELSVVITGLQDQITNTPTTYPRYEEYTSFLISIIERLDPDSILNWRTWWAEEQANPSTTTF